jgi:ABC-type uncharacterized transport system substrate-binding protein
MRRRDFIALLGGASATWPYAAHAQNPGIIPVVGYLHSESSRSVAPLLAAFREGLAKTGYIEGHNVAIEYRWAQGDFSKLTELAADLVGRRVPVIATPGSSPATLAAKAATTTIPIVFSFGLNPLKLGLVASLNHPGGNVTGVNSMLNELGPKRLEILHKLLPATARFALFVNPKNPTTKPTIEGVRRAAKAIDRKIEVLNASTEADIETSFASFVQKRIDAFIVHPDNLFISCRSQLVSLAAQYTIPGIYPLHEDAEAGGLMSYGVSLADVHHQVGVYVGRILNGDKPADLPVFQPTRFELLINLKTANALGLTIPRLLLVAANRVIE